MAPIVWQPFGTLFQAYWIKPGRGYSPEYRVTVWQLMFLTDLGVTRTEGIARSRRIT